MFNPPANINDLADNPELKANFDALWNSDSFMGNYVSSATGSSPNYVDPNVEPPSGDPVKVPWNGFPRLLSRWFDDEQSNENKVKAEEVADILTPIVSWVAPALNNQGDLVPRLFHSELHRVPFFAANNPIVAQLARPLRKINDDNTLGDELPRFRRQQDEYLEWHASFDDDGKLQKITYTAEPPDYWLALAQISPDRVEKLYQDLIDTSIAKEDLFFQNNLAAFGIDLQGQLQWFNIGRKGEYNELNEWTTTKGIMHLTHRANTLGAEVFLAGESSRVFASDVAPAPADPNAPPAEIRRIACGSYGGVNRSSDPLIGKALGMR